jgi:hypothetical protein
MTLENFLNGVWPALAGVLGGIGTIAVVAFTKLGDRVSEYLVSRQVEAFKHGLETQIEQLRARLAHITDRGARSNELEYAAVVAAWENFVDAYIATHNCIVSFISHPDFARMSDDDVVRYLKTTDFSDIQQKQVLEASDKNKMYSKVTELRFIAKAGSAIFDARSVLRKQGHIHTESTGRRIRERPEALFGSTNSEKHGIRLRKYARCCGQKGAFFQGRTAPFRRN